MRVSSALMKLLLTLLATANALWLPIVRVSRLPLASTRARPPVCEVDKTKEGEYPHPLDDDCARFAGAISTIARTT